ncbi:glycosyltransferase [Bacillus cereus]|uniref:glycosyltransferase n=1 Tax=Bacillus cereus TaxID=1396 RepID=UPI0024533025|nr:glycosyltransferase [Bacillus cereus]MDH4423930.1 glycosyltransferase [Bacillus cereus]
MKKILFVIDSLNSGGAEKSLVSLFTLFDYQKYEVDLLMFSPTGLYLPLLPQEINILDAPVLISNQHNGIKYLIKNKNFKELYIRIRTSISLRVPYNKKNMHNAQISWKWMSKYIDILNEKYDVAIAYSQGIPTYFVAEKVKADKKICWVNTDYKIAPYNKKIDAKYYEQYDNVVAVSDYNKTIFINEMPSAREKISVIYDIVSPNLIKSMASQDDGFDDGFDGLRILTIGRLVDAKGYDMAIEACYKLKKQGYKLKWYVIGEGNLKSKLENMIKEFHLEETFILLGTFQNPYVFLKQCDVYVQPSRFEGYGLALAEAKVLQKPIVSTNFTVVHNQIKDRENGVIVTMNSDAVYEGIRGIIEDNHLREYLCENLGNEDMGTEGEIKKLYSIIESV